MFKKLYLKLLRDYFAAKAMVIIFQLAEQKGSSVYNLFSDMCEEMNGQDDYRLFISEYAYDIADNMIITREKNK